MKHVCKTFTAYFEGIVELQESNAKHYARLGDNLSLPVAENAPYMAEEKYQSLQNLLSTVKEDTAQIASSYQRFGKNLETAVVEPLRQIRLELKAQSRSIENEVGKREQERDKWQTASSNALVTFNHALATHKAGNVDLTAKSEPYVAARNLKAVLVSELHHDNELKRVTIAWQQRCKTVGALLLIRIAMWRSIGSTARGDDCQATPRRLRYFQPVARLDSDRARQNLEQHQQDYHWLESRD
jgi:hypothetical protein